MIPIKNSNSDFCVLVLTRPADSLYTFLTAALREWEYPFSVYSTVYEVVNAARDIPQSRSTLLIARPAMLKPEALEFIQQHFPNLQVIGWLDPSENVGDGAIAPVTASGMLTASHLDQLRQVIQRLAKAMESPVLGTDNSKELDRVEYEMSDEEVSALLGVE